MTRQEKKHMRGVGEFERYCLDIYLKYHVSQLRSLSEFEQTWWKLGQDIYNRNKEKIGA